MPAVQLSHFSAALIFSLLASIVFGITQRNNPHDMLRYGLKSFAWFVLGLIGGGWFMWLLRH
jgi:hypothetical protein